MNDQTIKVWAPNARKVEVWTGGMNLPMIPCDTETGWWQCEGAFPVGTSYTFRVDGGEPMPDPRSREQPEGIHGASRIVDPNFHEWQDSDWIAPVWQDAVIYELHIGTFTPEGTFDSTIERLDHLVELGITHVELMPVVEFPGKRNWGYDGVSIYSPNHVYGGPQGLARLVDACHSRGLAVILDVVYNHMGPDGNYLPKFGPYFTDHHMTPWGPGFNFDGDGSHEVRRFFIDNALMWLHDYHFDGLRLDAVDKIKDNSPTHFLVELRRAVDGLSAETGRSHILIAESAANDPVYSRPVENGGYGMDAHWNDDFHHALRTRFTGEKDRYYVDYEGLPHLAKALNEGYVYDGMYSEFRGRMHGKSAKELSTGNLLAYMQTHDQVGNRPQGDRFHHHPAFTAVDHKIAAAITLLSPYVPMIFMGEEWASDSPFLFFTDHQNEELGRAVTEGRSKEFGGEGWDESVPDPQEAGTFLRSKLDWDNVSREGHLEMVSWYRDLLRLRKSNAARRPVALGELDVRSDSNEGWVDFTCGGLRVIASFSDAHFETTASDGSTVVAQKAGSVEFHESGTISFTGRGVMVLNEACKPTGEYPGPDLRQRIRDYIDATWHTLTRDPEHRVDAICDPKVEHCEASGDLKLYLSAREDLDAVTERLKRKMGERSFSRIELRVLPPEFDSITEHGLLYLPGPYVVPGGRFNEFYGWDSYFIQRGLLRGGHVALAKSMVDLALYEVEHYGMVLNANRTYYLTRSHPPVLSLMVMAQYKHDGDLDWLASAIPSIEKFYYYWTVPPHFNQATGLSRYYDLGEGAAPEVEFSERDAEGRTHYERVKHHLVTANVVSYDKSLYYDAELDALTPLAYKGDRSMRESGFDPTDRFGAHNLDVIHFAPVCLNVLLHRMEQDLAECYEKLGDDGSRKVWNNRAAESAERIDRYFWNEEAGLYFDYHFREESQRHYPFLTTFWPLWAGLSTPAQASRVRESVSLFLKEGGLQTSLRVTGEQWDAPFAWAPLQLLAVDGLERYGHHWDAREIARRFTAMTARCFEQEGVLREKYDADRCSASVGNQISFGYSSNEPGFGWTNAVVLEFLDRYFQQT